MRMSGKKSVNVNESEVLKKSEVDILYKILNPTSVLKNKAKEVLEKLTEIVKGIFTKP